MDELDNQIGITIDDRLVDKSAKQWDSFWGYWMEFCHLYNLDIKNVTETQLMRYAQFRALRDDNGWSAIRGQLYAIRSALLKQNKTIRIDQNSMPRLGAWLNGRRIQKPPKSGSKCITEDILCKWFEHLPKSEYDNCVFRAAYSLSHNTIRRNDEISQEKLGGIKMGDIKWQNGSFKPSKQDKYCVFDILRSKTNKLGKLHIAPIFCICTLSKVCCFCDIKLIYKWRKRDASPSTPLLQLASGKVMDYDTLRNKTQRLCEATNMDPKMHTLHGLRSGGNIDAKLRGISADNRQRLAGWKSAATRKIYEDKIGNKQLMNSIKLDMERHQQFVDKVAKKNRKRLKKLRKKKKQQSKK